MRFHLQIWRDWADLALKSVSVIAILVGGYWGYYQFFITDFDADNVQIALSTEVIGYRGDQRLLKIHAKPRNIGKVAVTPGRGGFVVTIKEVPGNLSVGAVDIDSLPDLYKSDIIKKFPGGYLLEPGVEYDELLTMVVPAGGFYFVSARMDLDETYEVDVADIVRID